jgi:hypothetical protein
MTNGNLLTDEQLGQAVADTVAAQVGSVAPADGLALLAGVKAAARVRRRQHRRTAGVALGGLAVAASVAWVLLGPGGFDLRGSGPIWPSHPSPSAVTKEQRSTGALAVGQVVGSTPEQLLSQGPYDALPPIPAGVQWGATAAQLRTAFLDRNADLVAFPFPADSVLHPADLGTEQVDIDLGAVQSTTLFPPLGTFSCTGGYDPGWSQVVAGLGISLWPATVNSGEPGAAEPTAPEPTSGVVTETLAAFEGDGAHRLLREAGALVKCNGTSSQELLKPEVLPTAGLPGDEAFAVVGRPGGIDLAGGWAYLGLARAGKVTVSVAISVEAPTDRADVAARGNALLASAVARVSTPEVRGLVARYVR